MAKIYSPNKSYTGVSANVAFAKGMGETNDKHLIEWFKEHGYTVDATEEEKPVDEMTVDELKTYAEGKNIDITGFTKKDDILSKIKAGK